MYYIPSDYDYYPADRYEMLRRQQAYQQAQRRAAYERQRREEALRRRLYEQELARREEEAYQRRLAYQREVGRQAQLRKEREARMGLSDDKDQDEYVVVRGPGGYLYRVRRSDLEGSNRTNPREPAVRDEDYPFENKENGVNVKVNTKPEEEAHNQSRSKKIDHPASLKSVKRPKSKKRVTVIVEDASDSETDDAEVHSLWRNRHPSPGESWMEPIGNAM